MEWTILKVILGSFENEFYLKISWKYSNINILIKLYNSVYPKWDLECYPLASQEISKKAKSRLNDIFIT